MGIRLAMVFLLALMAPLQAFCTHLRTADIIVEKVNCFSLTYRITLRVYSNTASSTPVGGTMPDDGHIDFGDNTIALIPFTPAISRPDLGTNIGVSVIVLEHTYQFEGTFKINYFERDRNVGIVNILNSGDVAYSSYTIIKATKTGCNSFPNLEVPPLDRACKGRTFQHNPGATDSDGDSLSYELTVPSKSSFEFVDAYIYPNDQRYYSNFSTGNEAKNGPPTFTIDPATGLLSWDAPGAAGEYNIAFKVIEWRRNPQSGSYEIISQTVRDMQIVVEDCLNNRPLIQPLQDVCIEAGKVLNASIIGFDPDNDPIKVEVFSSIFEGGPENFPASFSPVMTDFASSPVEIDFTWQTNCVHVRDQNYQVVFKITDNPPVGPRLVTFVTWNIKVIAPKPVISVLTPDLINRTASLQWEPYACANAEKIQIWRKVGSVPYTPGVCESGLSVYKGYELIDEVGGSQTSYYDDNGGKKLAVAAQYCYRLVATFATPRGGKSYVSLEWCMEPIRADAPVITHVTIGKTDTNSGEVTVRWLSPFQISKTQFPEPYEYEVYRGKGFDGNEMVNVSGRLKDLSSLEFTDKSCNTKDSIYNYAIVLYSRTENSDVYSAIDTSAAASTVRIDGTAGEKQIRLNWKAEVPWSNVIPENPWHRIYRGRIGDVDEALILIDSVNVTENGFEYVDTGEYQGLPLEDNVMYCYSVETRGTYGNPLVGVMRNRSQMVCLYPLNNLPPCIPTLNVDRTICEDYLLDASCGDDDFVNTMQWELGDATNCRQDIVVYNLYSRGPTDGEFQLLTTTNGTTFRDENLTSFARCYRVEAVDAQGNVSEMSEPSCNDNCPAFYLPNVFTPNGDGCNDFFSLSDGQPNDANPDCPIAEAASCPRFVVALKIKVLNRWGREVFNYESDQSNAILIKWNGRDKNGDVLETGTYFYEANVTFDSVIPENQRRKIKGWVQILY